MRHQFFIGHAKGRSYGIDLALAVLQEQMKITHKEVDIPVLAVNARIRAKDLQVLIRKVKELH
jgi:hypothetical protein